MASTSDPPPAGAGEEATVPTETATASSAEAPPPPSTSSSSSKRRWSPCTWRYAIEESQPELGSRPRGGGSSSIPPSLRNSDHAALGSTRSRPLHSQDHAIYARDRDEPARRSVCGSRADLSELRTRHAQPRTHDAMAKKKRPSPAQQPFLPYVQKEPAQRPKGDEEDDVENGWDDDGNGDDAELAHHFADRRKGKRRAMSPSELYYCEICRAKALQASKQSSSPDSPLPS